MNGDCGWLGGCGVANGEAARATSGRGGCPKPNAGDAGAVPPKDGAVAGFCAPNANGVDALDAGRLISAGWPNENVLPEGCAGAPF